jgi:hypothetical protein
MTVNRGLFVRNVGATGTTPAEGRLALAGLFEQQTPGVPRSGLLNFRSRIAVAGTAGLSYTVQPMTVVVSRAASEGIYLFTLTGTTTVATSAPASGARFDLIYVKQNDPDKGDPDNAAVVGIVQGTPATTPEKPYALVPAGALVLAEARVPAGATATNSASVQLIQVFPQTAYAGEPVPVRSKAEQLLLTVPGTRVLHLQNGRIDTLFPAETNVNYQGGWQPTGGALPHAWAARTESGTWAPRVDTGLLSVSIDDAPAGYYRYRFEVPIVSSDPDKAEIFIKKNGADLRRIPFDLDGGQRRQFITAEHSVAHMGGALKFDIGMYQQNTYAGIPATPAAPALATITYDMPLYRWTVGVS